jgi:hypothetical protein
MEEGDENNNVKQHGVFQMRYLRSGGRFSNLKRHKFSVDEKYWICELLTDQHSNINQSKCENISIFCIYFKIQLIPNYELYPLLL